MFAVLFGSYSMDLTTAGISSFLLLKSMILYFLLLPPPRCLTVILPWLLRPEFFFRDTTRDFSGVLFVISAKSEEVMCLLEGVYGLNVLIPILFLLSCHFPRIPVRNSPPGSAPMFILALYMCLLLRFDFAAGIRSGITVPGRSRCPCCSLSAQQLPFWLWLFFQQPYRGVFSFRPCSWYVHSLLLFLRTFSQQLL